MLYLIGLGLNEKGYSREAYDAISKADETYIENYTTNFPYDIIKLEKQFNKKFILADRSFIEDFKFLDEAKNSDIALLVYGSPLMATTHISVIQEAKKRKINTKIIHNSSVFDAVAETGLQLYKFGRIVSIPNFNVNSYIDIIKDNLKIKAHSLILIDIELKFHDALEKVEKDANKKGVKINKIIVCERLGLKDSKIYYGIINKLKSLKVKTPYCFIIPSKLHFMERDVLESFSSLTASSKHGQNRKGIPGKF